jgi:hypothetical protein
MIGCGGRGPSSPLSPPSGGGGTTATPSDANVLNFALDLAAAAGIGPTFDPFADQTSFLLGAFIFEDAGVTAYNCGATLLKDAHLLQYAAGIPGGRGLSRGQHPHPHLCRGNSSSGFVTADRSARTSLSQEAGQMGTDDIGVGNATNGDATIVDADADAITYVRQPLELLNIVYGGKAGGGSLLPQRTERDRQVTTAAA